MEYGVVGGDVFRGLWGTVKRIIELLSAYPNMKLNNFILHFNALSYFNLSIFIEIPGILKFIC